MFASIKRAFFISRSSASFRYHYGNLGDVAQVHLKLQEAGCPANELVDLYIAAGCKPTEFCHFLYYLHQWWIDEDEVGLSTLRIWAEEPNVRAADRQGLIPLLDKFWMNRKRESGGPTVGGPTTSNWERDAGEQARKAASTDKARNFKPRPGDALNEPSTLEMMGLGSWPEEGRQNGIANQNRQNCTFDASLEVTCDWCGGKFALGEIKTWRHGNTYLCPHCSRICNGW